MGSKEITPSIALDKIPPQNIEAEQAVLGAMLLNENVIPDILEVVEEGHFYKESHRCIFGVIVDLFQKRINVDIVTATEEIKKRKKIEYIGGAVYLTHLVDNVPSVGNAVAYAKIVREKGMLRSLINSAFQILSFAYQAEEDASTVLDRAEKLIFEISDKKIEGSYVHIKEVIKDSIEMIDSLYQKKTHITGVATGFRDFDRKTSGLQPGDLIVVAARPSMGKSAFVGCITEYVAVEGKGGVGFFSLEMSKEQLAQRMLCSHARVDANKVRTGYLSAHEWPNLTKAASKLLDAPIYIDDTPASSIFELRAKARRMKAHHNISLVVVDYLQLLRGAGRPESRQQEISEISRSLKALAKEINAPVIAVSQLSRAVESRPDHRPQLSDLRESGAIEQDADLVVLLLREEYYNADSENKGIAEIIIAKQRNGPTGSIFLGFAREYMKFFDLANVKED